MYIHVYDTERLPISQHHEYTEEDNPITEVDSMRCYQCEF